MEFLSFGIIIVVAIIFGPLILSLMAMSRISSLEKKIESLEKGYAILWKKIHSGQKSETDNAKSQKDDVF